MRFYLLFYTTLQAVLWFSFRAIFLSLQNLIWIVSGTRKKSRDAQYDPKSYNGTAHVQMIHFRFKMEQVVQSAGLNNFIGLHHSFQDPEYVLSPNITLYCVTREVAAFVESDPDVDVTLSKYSSFLRIAQFQQARKLIILPIHVFHALAERVGDPQQKLVFLTNTSRCGSTLLSQVFEETGKIMAIAEPDAMYNITGMLTNTPEQEISDLIRSSVRMSCKSPRPNTEAYVLKLSQPTIHLTPHILPLFPRAQHLFMYRNGLKVSLSIAKLITSVPALDFMTLYVTRYAFVVDAVRMFVDAFGVPLVGFDKLPPRLCPKFVGVMTWAQTIKAYLRFKEQTLPVKALRYEDIMADPHYALRQIFEHCGFSYDVSQTERAFSRDSQENSPLSMASLKPFTHSAEHISPDLQVQLDAYCESLGVPKIRDEAVLPDTITHHLRNGHHRNGVVNSNGIANGNNFKTPSSNGSTPNHDVAVSNS